MAWIALFLSLLSVAVVAVLYWRFRRKQEVSVKKFSDQVSGLLSEFNSVTSSKVELLDDRTEDLRRVVDRAEMKIEKLEDLLERAESVRESLAVQETSESDQDEAGTDQQQVVKLAREGYDETEIAERTNLTPGEISVILKVNDKTTVED